MINLNLIKPEWSALSNSYMKGWDKSVEVYNTMQQSSSLNPKKNKSSK